MASCCKRMIEGDEDRERKREKGRTEEKERYRIGRTSSIVMSTYHFAPPTSRNFDLSKALARSAYECLVLAWYSRRRAQTVVSSRRVARVNSQLLT